MYSFLLQRYFPFNYQHIRRTFSIRFYFNCTIETSKREVGIKIRAPSVVISNSSLIGVASTGTGIEVQEYNNVIKDCNIYGFTVGVLALAGAHDNEILGCNLFNNQIGVDIRINSHDNLVSECNIYVNDIGIHIWQNSNKNSVYLNNFWKNDIDAEAQGNNTWDNGIKGNYWENYQGTDSNGDGIGETPYTISEENKEFTEEIEGIAEGAEVDPLWIYALNSRS